MAGASPPPARNRSTSALPQPRSAGTIIPQLISPPPRRPPVHHRCLPLRVAIAPRLPLPASGELRGRRRTRCPDRIEPVLTTPANSTIGNASRPPRPIGRRELPRTSVCRTLFHHRRRSCRYSAPACGGGAVWALIGWSSLAHIDFAPKSQ